MNKALCLKPSGCIVLVFCKEDDLSISDIRFFGNAPGEKLPDLSQYKTARRTTANKSGEKPERQNTKEISIAVFKKLKNFDELTDRLFG